MVTSMFTFFGNVGFSEGVGLMERLREVDLVRDRRRVFGDWLDLFFLVQMSLFESCGLLELLLGVT